MTRNGRHKQAHKSALGKFGVSLTQEALIQL
jgi:hypothetical protein